MDELCLFAGSGGGLLGTRLLGWMPVGYVERNNYCQRVIAARISDGILPVAPIFSDIRTFINSGYAAAYQGLVNVVTAGWPCQPHSLAGNRRGSDDHRDLWPETAETVRIVRPQWFLGENVPGILSTDNGRYWGNVLRDLARMGYDAAWGVFSASSVGLPHRRKRVFIVAHSQRQRREIILRDNPENIVQTNCSRKGETPDSLDAIFDVIARMEKVLGESSVFRTPDGVAYRVERLESVGNGQVPEVVRKAWRSLKWRAHGQTE